MTLLSFISIIKYVNQLFTLSTRYKLIALTVWITLLVVAFFFFFLLLFLWSSIIIAHELYCFFVTQWNEDESSHKLSSARYFKWLQVFYSIRCGIFFKRHFDELNFNAMWMLLLLMLLSLAQLLFLGHETLSFTWCRMWEGEHLWRYYNNNKRFNSPYETLLTCKIKYNTIKVHFTNVSTFTSTSGKLMNHK